MNVTKKLLMTFKTDEDKNVSISVEDPKQNLTESEILEAMNLIIEKDVFMPNGEALVEKVGAKVVETETQEYDLVL
ncbi:MAG: DUF2922 domain-containing protein [Romboutsia sp.]|jgi:hypothetical protein|nr:DUF2922 domain-containing protein [Romboutsia sp.]